MTGQLASSPSFAAQLADRGILTGSLTDPWAVGDRVLLRRYVRAAAAAKRSGDPSTIERDRLPGAPADENVGVLLVRRATELFEPEDAEAQSAVQALVDVLQRATREGADAAVDDAADAAGLLIGRGPGLTPVGDDLVAGAIAAVTAMSALLTFEHAERQRLMTALVPVDVRDRTTSISAALLELALREEVIVPVRAALAPFRPGARQSATDRFDRLEEVGHSTGAAYRAAIGIVAFEIGGYPMFEPKERV